MKITELTAVTLGKKIKAKEITVAEAVSAVPVSYTHLTLPTIA